jgi:hypothetical protein
VYYTRLRRSLLLANLKQVTKPREKRESIPGASDRTDLEPQMGHKGNVKAGPGIYNKVAWHIPDANCGALKGRLDISAASVTECKRSRSVCWDKD